MPARSEVRICTSKLEKCIDDATRKNNFQSLEQLLQTEDSDNISHKCSKQFFSKFDKLICRELDRQEVNNVSTLLNSLQKYGKNIIIPGGDGLPAMIKYDLVEKAKEILIFRGNGKNEALTSLIEDFFDVLMLVYDTNSEGKIQTLESFVLRICTLVADVRINIYIQQEAVRKLNSMLDTMSREARKKIISTKEMLLVMNDMGKRILDAGDYDLQVAITEALCRMTSEKQRSELACQWFSMEFVTNAFKGIKDSEFETDCRKFLNQVNGMLGDKRRVFTYPCLSAILDKHELQIPLDENLEEFWIDFNVGSRSISFYIAADDENHQWETVSIPEEEVEMYSLEEKESKKLLTIILKNPVTVGNQEGKQIFLYFDPVLEIVEVARKVYGANKCKGFTKKQAISVAKTSVHIIFDESGSQVLVPESQLSPCLKEKSGMEEKSSKSEKQQLPVQQRNQNKKTNQDNCKNIQFKIATPSKRKVSEASVIVPGTGRLPLRSPLVFVNTSTPRKTGFKLPLQMMSSSEKKNVTRITESGTKNLDLEHTGPHVSSIADSLKRSNVATKKGREDSVLDSAFCETQQNTSKIRIRNEAKLSEKHIPPEKVLEMIQNEADSETSQKQMLDELLDIVPDSQPVGRNDESLLPGLLESSADENKIWKKQTCSVSEMLITKCDKQKRSTSSGHTFQQVPVLSERAAKQKAFYSIFESTSPKRQAQSRKITEKHLNETKKPEENCTIHRRQTLNSSKHLEQKILSTEAKEVPTTSETSFKSAHPTKMTEKSLVYSTKSVLARDSKEEVDISFRKGTTNHKKSEKNSKSKEIAETTELIISKISDRYKQKDDIERAREVLANNRSYLSKSDFKANKVKVQNRSFRNVKTTAVLNITTGQIVDDVYNFNLSGFDEPTIKLGIQELHVTELKASTDMTEKMNPDGSKSTIQKKVDKNRTNKNKKHLFSDTDTEYRGDDSKTDISWLRESNRKPKPQLIDYSRTKNLKKSKSIEAIGTFPDPAHLMDISEGKKTKNKKVSASKKLSAKADERIKQTTRPKLPRRAAALAKKSYKDYSNSESESEQESPECLCRTEKLRVQQEHKNGQNNAMNQQKELENNVSTEPKKEISRNQQKIFTKSKDPIRQRKPEMSPLSSPESPASVETMRCAEKGPEEAFAQEHVSLKRSTSSYLQDSTPEKRESLSIVKGISANKLHTIKKNNQSVHLKQSPENVKKLVFRNESLSPVLSPLSLPSLTPVTMDKAVMSEKDIEVSEPEVETYINEAVNVTNYLSDKLSISAELKDLIKNTQNKGEESVPPSQLCTPSGSREQSWCEEPCGTIHESGPTVQVNLKRMYHCDAESDSDEVEMRKEEEEERKPKLLPRKLFKADDDTTYKGKSIMQCARTHSFSRKGKKWSATNEISVSESISTVSVNELSVLDGEFCEPGCSTVGISQKLHKEFTRKIQSRSRRMDHFTKQSLKTAQHHLTAMGCQLHECRIKQLDKFHFTIVEELESFEKDSQSLKNMEKELLNFWKKHACTFSACKKNEQRRIQILKTSFEKNISHSVNYEQNIFTSEMHLMKEDMKGLQEKLLKEMVDLLILVKDFLPA